MKSGKFKVSSGSLVLGDPCYETGSCCDISTVPARNGVWTAKVSTCDADGWGRRVKGVVVHKEDFNPAAREMKVEMERFFVDSGQAGVFDGGLYGGPDFYEMCCTQTLSERGFGFVEGGFVTSSGYGDGVYVAEIHKIAGEAVCIEINFI
jgi:hypothetical protein